jgi:hypothetical protein
VARDWYANAISRPSWQSIDPTKFIELQPTVDTETVQFLNATIAGVPDTMAAQHQESNAMNNQLSLVEYRALPLRERGKLENWRRMSEADQALFQAEQRRPSAPTSESVDDAAVEASVKRIAENWFLASGFVTQKNEGRSAALNPVVARILDSYGAASGFAKS